MLDGILGSFTAFAQQDEVEVFPEALQTIDQQACLVVKFYRLLQSFGLEYFAGGFFDDNGFLVL